MVEKMRKLYDISYKIEDLELRKTETLGSNPIEYYEIVKWERDKHNKEYCYTVALFKEDKDFFVNLEFCLDRYKNVDWADFKILIDTGYSLYEKINGEVD
jgi:hypothetical protein